MVLRRIEFACIGFFLPYRFQNLKPQAELENFVKND
mgnify:CR=1 FL=1